MRSNRCEFTVKLPKLFSGEIVSLLLTFNSINLIKFHALSPKTPVIPLRQGDMYDTSSSDEDVKGDKFVGPEYDDSDRDDVEIKVEPKKERKKSEKVLKKEDQSRKNDKGACFDIFPMTSSLFWHLLIFR